ncbi:hypothetical protein TURU_026774 [Turdus rufiventris]|nr:hypothetical protein TURU_026774 [Turdus rufiventris]
MKTRTRRAVTCEGKAKQSHHEDTEEDEEKGDVPVATEAFLNIRPMPDSEKGISPLEMLYGIHTLKECLQETPGLKTIYPTIHNYLRLRPEYENFLTETVLILFEEEVFLPKGVIGGISELVQY